MITRNWQEIIDEFEAEIAQEQAAKAENQEENATEVSKVESTGSA